MPDWIYKTKKSPYWQYDFVIDGARFSGSTKTAKKPVARKYVEKLREEILTGNHGRQVLTLGQAATLYYDGHGKHQKSSRWIEGTLKALCEGLGSRLPLKAIGTP